MTRQQAQLSTAAAQPAAPESIEIAPYRFAIYYGCSNDSIQDVYMIQYNIYGLYKKNRVLLMFLRQGW